MDDYKTVCDTCGRKTWYETEQPCKCSYIEKCGECGKPLDDGEMIPCKGTLRVIDNSNIDPMFLQYLHKRVEATTKTGERERFIVGRSTGWKPSLLKIKTIRSMGGDLLKKGEFVSVHAIN